MRERHQVRLLALSGNFQRSLFSFSLTCTFSTVAGRCAQPSAESSPTRSSFLTRGRFAGPFHRVNSDRPLEAFKGNFT
jgi:hypothetical protein